MITPSQSTNDYITVGKNEDLTTQYDFLNDDSALLLHPKIPLAMN